MSKQFRFYDLNQPLLLPSPCNDGLLEGPLTRFLNEVVDEQDLSAIYPSYEKDGRGQAAIGWPTKYRGRRQDLTDPAAVRNNHL